MSWALARVVGVRRARPVVVALAVVVLAAALLLAGGVLGAHPGRSDRHEAATSSGTTVSAASAGDLSTMIAKAQQRLRRLPGDYVTWAALGAAYLEQARVTADPSYYPRSEGALRRSLAVRTKDNTAALTGLGALANARHDFATGRALARQALAKDPYDADTYGVLADAETQLGNTTAATTAVQQMLDLSPGVAALTRGSYDLEQRGQTAQARTLMLSALTAAASRPDMAFCRYQLGELAWNSGDLAEAYKQYTAGLAVDPDYLPLYQGTAKVAAARGNFRAALAGYDKLTQRSPTPTYLLEYAELLRAAGHGTQADGQLALADAARRLYAANGGQDDLTATALALDRSQPAAALVSARREWKRRHFADVADTLAQALHANGLDAEALRYAELAAAPGAHNARYLYHRGVIEAALGQRVPARRDLTAALALNPYFSVVDAPAARRALAAL